MERTRCSRASYHSREMSSSPLELDVLGQLPILPMLGNSEEFLMRQQKKPTQELQSIPLQ